MNNCTMVPNVEYKVARTISDQLGVPFVKIKLEDSIDKDLGADSLDIIEIGVALEVEFVIEISDEDMDNLSTVGDIINYIEGRVKK